MSKASKQRATSTRREQLRAQQLAEAKRRQRRMRVIYALCVVVVLAVIATVAAVVINDRNNKKEQAAKEAASQIVPPNALPDGTGIVANPGKFAADAPVVTIYQDYQCPACKSAEAYFGETINKLADAGKIKLEYRTLTFLDKELRNDSSERAARAASCADSVGAFRAYHNVIFTNQPEEGLGFTEDQLRVEYAAKAGITGDNLTKFQACYDGNHTAKWVRESYEKGTAGWSGSTPQYNINGANPMAIDEQGNPVLNDKGEQTDWWRVLEPTEESWLAAFAKYGKQGASTSPSSTPSPTPSK